MVKNNQRKKEIRSKIRQAKEAFYRSKCEETETLQAKQDNFNIHKKVKELVGLQNSRQPTILTDQNGKIITDIEEKLKTWKNYIEKLYEDDRDINRIDTDHEYSGPEITEQEVIYAKRTKKEGKAGRVAF